MLTLIVALLALGAVTWLIVTQLWLDDLMATSVIGRLLGSFFMFILGGALGGMVVLGVGALSYALNDSGKQVAHEWGLRQIAHDQGLHGRFYLGSGTVDSEQEFVAYYKEDGGYKLGQFPANKTLVIEKDTESPTLYEYDKYVSRWLIPNWAGVYHYRYVIVVPEGSIAPAVNLNLAGRS